MTAESDDLQLRRGRLLERIAVQRATLARDAEPLAAALQTTDTMIARARAAADYLRQHPAFAVLGVGTLLALRGGGIWRWGKRGFVAWRIWRAWNQRMAGLGLRRPR